MKRALLMSTSAVVALLGTAVAAAQSPNNPNMVKPQSPMPGPRMAPANIGPVPVIPVLPRKGLGIKTPPVDDGSRLLFPVPNDGQERQLDAAEVKDGVVSDSKSKKNNQNQSGTVATGGAASKQKTARFPKDKGAAAGANLGLSPAGQKIDALRDKLELQ